MIVMKFGGTSTQDAAAVANVVQIVKAHYHSRPVVVISAIAQATNTLEAAGRAASEGDSSRATSIVRGLIDRHSAMIDQLINDDARRDALREIVAGALAQLEELVTGVSILRELTLRSMDAFYCFGELLSSRIVAAALQEEGIPAEWIDTKEFMVTDENFSCAAPLMEVVEERLVGLAAPLIERGVVPVTQGFIGVSGSGRRTTMGRESSDYSAAVIGAALNARSIQIWTDVDGVLTADPRVVQSPRKVKVLSFDEAYELSFFGAKVLHPKTMLPAIEKNIQIQVYNSRRPQSSGTLVAVDAATNGAVVKSIAYMRDVIVVRMKPKKRSDQYIFWEFVFNVLSKYGAKAHLTASSEYNLVIALDAKSNVQAILHDIADLGAISVLRNKAILCLVGAHIDDSPMLLGRLFSSLAARRVSLISFGASSSSVSVVLDDDCILDVVRDVHDAFFADAADAEIFEPLSRSAAV